MSRASASDDSDSDLDGSLGDVLAFMRLLWELDHELRSASKRLLAVAGVTGPQRLALRMLGRFPDSTAGRLAEILHVHPSTLTGILERLERGGLIQREEDPEDRRRARFRLSVRGAAVNAMRSGTVEDTVRKALSRLPAKKVEAARDVLAELCGALERSSETSEVRARRPRKRSSAR